MLFLVVITALLALLILAGLTDLRQRRIPNWLNAGVALLYPAYVVVAPYPVAWPSAIALAFLVLLLGIGLFARNLIGGGDVKLIAATSLWAGAEHLLPFLLVTTLTGGALCLITLWFQRWGGLLQAYVATSCLTMPFGGASDRPDEPQAEPQAQRDDQPTTLPYGIAIAAGGVAVIIELLKL